MGNYRSDGEGTSPWFLWCRVESEMEQVPAVGQRVTVNWDGVEAWEGTVVEPRTPEARAHLERTEEVLVEWGCALQGEEWFPGRHRQVHPRHELIAVVNGARHFGPIENN